MSEEKKIRGPRSAAVYVVDMNGETHYVKAKSKSSALMFAVNQTVKVRKATMKDLADIASAAANGAEIHDAAA